jgi:hypothetical protein
MMIDINGKEQLRIRDTKNVVKNLFRLFQTWLEKNSLPELELG